MHEVRSISTADEILFMGGSNSNAGDFERE
jgi:hypothetical protein